MQETSSENQLRSASQNVSSSKKHVENSDKPSREKRTNISGSEKKHFD
jgi:hypothetical protein